MTDFSCSIQHLQNCLETKIRDVNLSSRQLGERGREEGEWVEGSVEKGVWRKEWKRGKLRDDERKRRERVRGSEEGSKRKRKEKNDGKG